MGSGALVRIAALPGATRLARLAVWLRRRLGGKVPEAGFDLDDRIQALMWAGVYEPGTCGVLEAVLVEGSHFIDVGAHVGYFAMRAARRVGPAGLVDAFEPDPVNVETLRRNTGRCGNVRVWPLAVADRMGRVTLWRSVRESGWGSIFHPTPDEGHDPRTPVKAQAVPLDDWAERHLPSPSRDLVLKIDVEGAEPRVLRGAGRLLSTAVRAAIVEINEVCLRRDGCTPDAVHAPLLGAGFSLWAFPSAGRGPFDMVLAVKGLPPPTWVPLAEVRQETGAHGQ